MFKVWRSSVLCLVGKWLGSPTVSTPDSVKQTLEQTYQVVSTASVDALWHKITDLATVSSWHPLITSTNVPKGLIAKPGLIYRVVTRWIPVPIKIFVENVLPGELLSIRIFPVPGLEERVVYQIESTLCGTQISYTVKLRGWLSPLAWSFLRPHAAQVAAALARAAEQPQLASLHRRPFQDFLGLVILLSSGWLYQGPSVWG
jgi:hypothetical protein